MDPNSGRVLTHEQLYDLRAVDPTEAARFTVELRGTEEEIQKISDAVKHSISVKEKAARRARNKAARAARRAGR